MIFASGTSIGSGLTSSKQEYIYQGKKYVDTPGLSDIILGSQAANEIEEALKETSNCKIVFVVTLESARVKPEDISTINRVLDAVTAEFKYGIIFNKVTEKVSRKISSTLEYWSPYLKELRRQSSSITFIKRNKEMEDKDNVYLPLNCGARKELLQFIVTLPCNTIAPAQVLEITGDVDNVYQDKVMKLKEMEEKIEKEKGEYFLATLEFARRRQEEITRIQREQERYRQELENRIAEDRQRRERQEIIQRQRNRQAALVATTATVVTVGCNVM